MSWMSDITSKLYLNPDLHPHNTLKKFDEFVQAYSFDMKPSIHSQHKFWWMMVGTDKSESKIR